MVFQSKGFSEQSNCSIYLNSIDARFKLESQRAATVHRCSSSMMLDVYLFDSSNFSHNRHYHDAIASCQTSSFGWYENHPHSKFCRTHRHPSNYFSFSSLNLSCIQLQGRSQVNLLLIYIMAAFSLNYLNLYYNQT